MERASNIKEAPRRWRLWVEWRNQLDETITDRRPWYRFFFCSYMAKRMKSETSAEVFIGEERKIKRGGKKQWVLARRLRVGLYQQRDFGNRSILDGSDLLHATWYVKFLRPHDFFQWIDTRRDKERIKIARLERYLACEGGSFGVSRRLQVKERVLESETFASDEAEEALLWQARQMEEIKRVEERHEQEVVEMLKKEEVSISEEEKEELEEVLKLLKRHTSGALREIKERERKKEEVKTKEVEKEEEESLKKRLAGMDDVFKGLR